jgi:RNA polymerase sigma-70 factor (ECF subfamily)
MENPPQPAQVSPVAAFPDAERWVDEHGDFLFRFALMRLRDPARAEDAVQETFLAALKGADHFAGRSAERSWLAGILKNKICDWFRRSDREVSFTDLDFYADEEQEDFVPVLLGKQVWSDDSGPQEWCNFGESLDNDLFWKAYRDCAGKLPEKIAAAFNMREVDGVESKEVCALLKISEANLWVMLHRARMALRRCLETSWFARDSSARVQKKKL